MIKIRGEKGSGKTTKLLHIAYATHYVLVEPTSKMANFARRMAKEKNLDVKVISAEEFIYDRQGRRDTGYLVDELNMFLENLNIKGYSDGPGE